MVNYQNGKIYMIESLIGNCRYYGSTTQTLAQRLGKHKQDIKIKYVSSKEVLQYPDFRILLVKKFPCDTRDELEAEEAVFIRNNDCVNKNIPQRTMKEYREDNKDKIKDQRKQFYEENKDRINEKRKEVYEENKDKIKEQGKIYYEKNKDKIIEQVKIYYEEHKDEIKEQHKEYYEKNKDKISGKTKVYRDKNKDKISGRMKVYYEEHKDEINERREEKHTCECGCIIRKGDIARHRKSQKHLKLLEKLTKSPQILS